jgi:hypothetical protein
VPVNSGLSAAVIVASLALALWCLVTAVRDRVAGRAHLVGASVVEVLVLALVGVAVAGLVSGHRPAAFVTFVGYVVMTVLLLPAAVGLSLMERTRWGAAIIAGGSVVVPVLVLRLHQLWPATGG